MGLVVSCRTITSSRKLSVATFPSSQLKSGGQQFESKRSFTPAFPELVLSFETGPILDTEASSLNCFADCNRTSMKYQLSKRKP